MDFGSVELRAPQAGINKRTMDEKAEEELSRAAFQVIILVSKQHRSLKPQLSLPLGETFHR